MCAWRPLSSPPDAKGSEGGAILLDEEHPLGARLTLEALPDRFAITCGIYGWMVHTRFFSTEDEGRTEALSMQRAIAEILTGIPTDDEYQRMDEPSRESAMRGVTDFIAAFVEQFP